MLLDGQFEQCSGSFLHMLWHQHSSGSRGRRIWWILVSVCAKHQRRPSFIWTGISTSDDIRRILAQSRVNIPPKVYI